MTEKELDLLREGRIAIRFGDDGQPVGMYEPLFEMRRFVSALARGYMRLYQSEKIRGRCQKEVR
jgi:hypothetical protein